MKFKHFIINIVKNLHLIFYQTYQFVLQDFLSDKVTQILDAYISVLSQGKTHLFHVLPRMLTIWLDNTEKKVWLLRVICYNDFLMWSLCLHSYYGRNRAFLQTLEIMPTKKEKRGGVNIDTSNEDKAISEVRHNYLSVLTLVLPSSSLLSIVGMCLSLQRKA